MDKFKYIFTHIPELLLSAPKTVFFNFCVLPIRDALKFPFLVSYHVKLRGVKRKNFIVECEDLHFATSRIGFEYTVGAFNKPKKSIISIENGRIILKGSVGLSQGVILSAKNSDIVLGDNFRCNYSTVISSCDSDITFGSNVVLGWNIEVKSDDGHTVLRNGLAKEKNKPVRIGNHVWICSNSSILKGACIGNNCVLAYGSVLTTPIDGDNLLIGGVPAKRIVDSVDWIE